VSPLTHAGGTYTLLARMLSTPRIAVGRIGVIRFPAGHYAYVGSALGPGGLAARLRRYAAGPRRLHWHIDYLLQHAEVTGALICSDDRRLECRWAAWFDERAAATIDGFGASDCRCRGHLFNLGSKHAAEEIIGAAGLDLKADRIDRTEMMGDR
jgi:Uri superfamily endonuclease